MGAVIYKIVNDNYNGGVLVEDNGTIKIKAYDPTKWRHHIIEGIKPDEVALDFTVFSEKSDFEVICVSWKEKGNLN